MKALEMLRAKKSQLLPVLPVEKTQLVTEKPLINKVVTTVATVASHFNNTENEFSDFVIVKVCNECDFFQPDKINPPAGMGRCKLGINRKNKPLYPMQDACDKSKPLSPF